MNKTDFKIFSLLLMCIVFLGLSSAFIDIIDQTRIIFAPKVKEAPIAPAIPTVPYIPQFVLISFDGSRSNDIWKDIRSLKDEMRASSTPVNFTHFINAAYFLTSNTRHLYKGPGKEIGKTNIGVSEDLEHIRTRINEINIAIAEGDEIEPHTVGHFSGIGWTREQWKEEFASFNDIMFRLETIYPEAHLPRLTLATSSIIGFRAPYIDKSPGLYEALHDLHMRYDTSEIGTGADWPTKDESGLWHIPLGTMKTGKAQRNVLAMDYNIYFQDSKALDIIKKGTPEWQTIHEDTLLAFLGYFNTNYSGNRAPVLVGYHFEGWNDGAYWEAMKSFTRQVCGKPEVRCGTFRELVDYLDKNGVPKK